MSAILQIRSPFDSPFSQSSRTLPLHAGSPRSERTHTTSSSASMGPPSTTSPEVEQRMDGMNGSSPQYVRDPNPMSAAALTAAQGQKVVQTAFIHKLYSMLEDKTIEHLISWSNGGDSFVMSPSNEFSKVLAQYFKHTNISSFVRQLNMYGFHKVSDVFHTGSSESALWEFRHGNGSFKRGDLVGLRDIKRRASRHTLIHRDSFASQPPPPPIMKSGPSHPGTPADLMPDNDQRLAYLESMFHDVYSRLSRTEDSYAMMSTRCHSLTEQITKCHSWIKQLSQTIHAALPPEVALRNDLISLQKEVERQQDMLRSADLETTPNGRNSYYPSNMATDPVSPRGYAFSDSRRSSIQMSEPPPPPFALRPPVPPIPPQFSSPSRGRYGSISGATTSPAFTKPQLPMPAQPHPLSNVTEPPPNLARRHTSADIREHWPPGTNGSPFPPVPNPGQWPPESPNLAPDSSGDQALQNQLANYQINGSSRRTTITVTDTESLPPAHVELAPPSGLGVGNISWGVGVSKFPRPNFDLHSAPATRRSSMVHSLLNPADTAEQENEDDSGPLDDRKRKRLM